MSKWGYAQISELFEHIRNGVSIQQGIDGGYPITRIETISKGYVDRDRLGYAGIYDPEKYSNYFLQTGDILMSHINSKHHLGKVAFYEKVNNEIIIHGMNLLSLRPKPDRIDYKFSYYYFLSHRFRKQLPHITKNSVNQSSFSVTSLKKLIHPIPPLDIQKQIAHELDTVSELLALRKRQLEELDQLIKSTFYEMFGDPVKNEKGWEEKFISEICILNPKKSELTEIKEDTLVSFIPMSSVSEFGEIDTNQTKVYNEVKSGFTYFRENDVLFAKITPCMENGKGAVARNLCNTIGFGSTEFHVLRAIENLTDSEWLYRLSNLPVFRANAEKNMTGSAGQKRVPVSFFEKFRVGLPPIVLQREYASIVTQIKAKKSLVKQSIDETQLLFDSLMSKYFDE